MNERAPAAAFEPFFLEGPAGPLFAVFYPAAAAVDTGLDLLHVPAFAEEMNRSRRMVALQARALAPAGVGVLLVDLFGTGDSQGAFRDSEYEIWRGDVLAAAAWLERRGGRRVGLWGLRFGGLLAMNLASDHPARFERVLLWNPVTDGGAMLTQFLRIRVAASMRGRREDTKTLRSRLEAGEAIDVAGYTISPTLAAALDAARVAAPPPTVPVDWIELVPEAGRDLSPAGKGTVERWRHSGARVAARTAFGEPFWSLLDITVAPDLIDVTTQLFGPPVAGLRGTETRGASLRS